MPAQPAEPSLHALWLQAGGGTKDYDPQRYRDLLREAGLLLMPGDDGYEGASVSSEQPHRGEGRDGD